MSSDPANTPRHDTISDPYRLRALADTRLLDSPPEPTLDELTAFAAKVLKVPTVLITLIDRDRQFFASQCGLTGDLAQTRQGPLSHSVCRYVVEGAEPLVVGDTRQHPVLKDHPGVLDSGVRAYAGVPLINKQGFRLGTFCAFAQEPRAWSLEDVDLLRACARQAVTDAELRHQTRALDEELQRAKKATRERQTLTRLTVNDLRGPLTPLTLGLEMLDAAGPLNDAQKEFHHLCQRSVSSLQRLIERLLDLEAIAERGAAGLDCGPCDPSGLAMRAWEESLAAARDVRVRLERAVPPNLPVIEADATKVLRMLTNLLADALQVSPRGDTVRISAELVKPEENEIHFTIRGTGSGRDNEAFDHLFDNAGDRSPLSPPLRYCQQIATAHGGRIWTTRNSSDYAYHVALPRAPRQHGQH